MWELDCEESWALKNWCFWTVVLEKTLESPLDCKELQPVHSKGDQSWVFIGRTDAKAETLATSCEELTHWKRPLMLGGIGVRKRRGWQRIRWLDGIDSMDMSLSELQEFLMDWRPGVLPFMGSQRVEENWATEPNWTEVILCFLFCFVFLRNLPRVVITLKDICLNIFNCAITFYFIDLYLHHLFFYVLKFSFDTFFTWIFSSLELSFHYFFINYSLFGCRGFSCDMWDPWSTSPIHYQKIGLKIYWAWPCPPEQDPVLPTASPSHQEASINLLSSSIREQTK